MEAEHESETEWEEVESGVQEEKGCDGGRGSLEIVVGGVRDGDKKGKGKASNWWQKALASLERELRLQLHQTHLLCLLARGMLLSQQCDDPTLQSILLSVLGATNRHLVPDPAPWDPSNVTLIKLLKWLEANTESLLLAVKAGCELGVPGSGYKGGVSGSGCEGGVSETQLLVSLLRCLGLRTRLVMVLTPPPLKVPARRKDVGGTGGGDMGDSRRGDPSEGSKETGFGERLLQFNLKKELQGDDEEGVAERGVVKGRGKGKGGGSKGVARKQAMKKEKGKGKAGVSPYFKELEKGKKKLNKSRIKKDTSAGPEVTISDTYVPSEEEEESDDKEYVANRKRKRKSVKATPIKKLKKALSKDSASLSPSTSTGSTTAASQGVELELVGVAETGSWAEVYVPGRKKWLCVHAPSCSVDQPQMCEKHCRIPLHYVVAFEKSRTVRDITARYASDWCTDARRHRVSANWWDETLRPYQSDDLVETMQENEAIMSRLKSQPLPLTITEYKNHPLYALKRHLLKFEALYPEDSPVVGHCKGEAVYARSNVHMLHTKDTWLKEGRLVRLQEKAYRVVKARPKRGQSSAEAVHNTVEVYGRWQTEEYMPPLVIEGKVPRNEYGNVELFKPSMLPVGGAHIKIQGIQRVAKKLNIDFAPAMIGWDFHGGYNHPVFDGIVVAKESEELLLEAWQTEEQIILEKEMKKREQRVLERWRKLVRGVVIRDRVRHRFENINS